MSDIEQGAKSFNPAYVRAQLDEILAGEIVSFIKMDYDLAVLSYNLATITCIVTAVEREDAIRRAADTSLDRFTRKSFIDELADIGLERDESLNEAVDSVIKQGYITVDSKGKLKAEISAYTIAGFLDTMFPGMQGMNLVAFVMQMNDEVNSGRKSLEEAKSSFLQTLKSRGVAVTREKLAGVSSDIEDRKKPDPGFKKISDKLKKANAQKRLKLKLKKASKKPSFYSSTGYTSDNVEVKSIFDKGPSKEEIKLREAAEKAAAEQKSMQAQRKAKELAEMKERIEQAEKKAKETEKKAQKLAVLENELESARAAAQEAEKKALELRQEAEKSALMEAELAAMEEKLKKAEEARSRVGKGAAETVSSDESEKTVFQPDPDDIEARIAAFEEELAMPCPLCREGEVILQKTSAGKEYYTCSNKECRFVSWSKPYHFQCPLCKNPYLVEFTASSGEKGLKCPRAACSYSQDNLLDPVQNLAAQAEKITPKKKKKKRIVRRVRRRH